MRIVFMGTPQLAAAMLTALLDAGQEVIGVVTQPDRPKGRSKALAASPVKETALLHGLQVYQPERVREPAFVEVLRALAPKMIVVAAFGQILPEAVLALPPRGCVNVHMSLLPRYRGASPIQSVLLSGEQKTGVTIMYMDRGIDTGDIISSLEVPIAEKETAGTLHDKLCAAGAALLTETLPRLADGTASRTPQEAAQATYVRTIEKEMGRLDFTRSAVELERLIRAMNPWPSAYTTYQGRGLKLWAADVINEREETAKAAPGEIVSVQKACFYVQTGCGLLAVTELQLEGKKRMDCAQFLRGVSVQAGERLG